MTVKTRSLRRQLLIGASIGSMLLAGTAYAQDAGWGGGRGGRAGGADPAAAAARAAQQQAERSAQTNSASQRAITAFRRAAEGRAAMQSAQAAARAAARAAQSNAPNGLGRGGLQVADGVVFGPDGKPVEGSLWIGANGPTQTQGTDGRTAVAIDQTKQQAILTWDSFNVGRETDLSFNQSGADAVVLNRVTDASADPSRILGSIKAPGTVLVLNRNGIIFGGASQVNVRNLVASTADITDDQFLTRGIYSNLESGSYSPSFTAAGGAVTVEAGAQISTLAPTSVTTGGGYVLLMGTEITNAGSITTPRGQTLLSAGDDFVIRKGFGTKENQYSTTRGNEARSLINAKSTSGTVINSGQIEAAQGDITLAGRTIRQDGVAVATTSVNQRGTIHLLNSASDTEGSVTLGKDSLTLILPELDAKDTALDSQRDALIKSSTEANTNRASTLAGGWDDRSTLADRLDQSRVEVVTGGDVLFEGGSHTMANGGQVAVQANTGRITVATGANIDVSGTMGVALDMASNSIRVNIQGNELRDSPLNRDAAGLKNQNAWIDVRDLILLPAGTNGYESDRYYTPGGLLEVGGYIGNTPHSIGEWTSVGGTITLAAQEIVAQQGAVLDISGGSLDYAAGYVRSTNVLGADGRLYDLRNAPSYLQFLAVGNAFGRTHDRWGPQYTEVFTNRLFSRGTSMRWEDGYTVGRDAGRLILSTPTALFEADILAQAVNGERQTDARPAGLTDGYKAGQNTAARGGTLALVGPWDVGAGNWGLPNVTDVRFGAPDLTSPMLSADNAIISDRVGTAWFNSAHLNAQSLGGLDVSTSGGLLVDKALEVTPGGIIQLTGTDVEIGADLTARAGTISVTGADATANASGTLILREDVVLDARGLWTNVPLDGGDLQRLAYLDGGQVSLTAGGDLTMERGSVIDASAGGAILYDGLLRGGSGGDVSISSSTRNAQGTGASGKLEFDGEVKAYGFNGGGTLTIRTGDVVVVEDKDFDLGTSLRAGQILPVDVVLSEDVVWPAGKPLPAPVSIDAEKIVPEGVLKDDATVSADYYNNRVPVTADINISADGLTPNSYNFGNYYFILPDGNQSSISQYSDGIIPKGSYLTGNVTFLANLVSITNGSLSLGVVTTKYDAGATAPVDVTFHKGDRLLQNSTLATAVNFEPLKYLHLQSELLNNGFSNYDISGDTGLIVGADAPVRPTAPILRLTDASRKIPTDADPYGSFETYLAPAYLEDPLNSALVQRPGADLLLRSGLSTPLQNQITGGWLQVRKGASIEVDPGRAIELASGGQITMDGGLFAAGGNIDIVNRSVSSGTIPSDPGTLSVWIGESAVIDAAARAQTAVDAHGHRYGVVPDGGHIVLGSESEGGLAAVMVRPGASIDASGASARLDLQAGNVLSGDAGSINLASRGGSIVVGSSNGIYLDGTMRAAAGGKDAEGGSLSVLLAPASRLSLGGQTTPDRLGTSRRFTITQNDDGSGLADDLAPGAGDPVLRTIQARLSSEQVRQGGFDNLTLAGGNGFFIDGDVELRTGRAITLRGSGLYNTQEEGRVRIVAPYLFLDGAITPANGGIASGPSDLVLGKSFTAEGRLIDVRNAVAVNFAQSSLQSGTDLRFLASTDAQQAGTPTTRLEAAGDLDLIAQQLYPTTQAVVEVSAGPMTGAAPNDNLLRIRSVDGSLPSQPYSVFGSIALTAGTIEQGGIVRAPLGRVSLGVYNGILFNQTANISLLPGSVTSVSAAGLVIPYGGTADGVKWTVNGDTPVTVDVVDGRFSWSPYGNETQGITLSAQTVTGDKGSTLDLSGGGTLLGGAFVAGRGGSVDALLYPREAGNQVYAIVPGVVTAPVAGGYYAKWTGDVPGVGEQITIPAGVPGLSAGTYTLMPANYALLPGAYRVELGDRSVKVPAALRATPDGAHAVGVTRSVTGTGIRDTVLTQATITSGDVLRRLSQYDETRYDDYLRARAAITGALRPSIAGDGKWLTLFLQGLTDVADATPPESFSFAGKANFAASDNGYDGSLLLRTDTLNLQQIVVTGAHSTTERTNTILPIRADMLNALNAPALYIGPRWTRIEGSNSIGWFNQANSLPVTLEAGAVLRAGQVMIGTGIDGAIVLESGSGIDTLGHKARLLDSTAGYLFGRPASVYGEAALLAVSNGHIVLNPNSGVGSSTITIGDGAFLYSEGTIGFNSAQGVAFEGTPLLATRDLALALASINIGEAGELESARANGVLPNGLNLDRGTLERILGAGGGVSGRPRVETLSLGAAQSINFFGDVDLDLTGTGGEPLLDQLVLNTPAIYGLGASGDNARLSVDTLVWNGNVRAQAQGNNVSFVGALPGAVLPGGAGTGLGTLDIDAREMILGYPGGSQPDSTIDFNRLVLGFSSVNLNASERIVSNNRGNLAVYQSGRSPDAAYDAPKYAGFGGSLNLSTPLLTGAAGSAMTYRTGGALTLRAPAGTAASTAGGGLGATVDLVADNIDLASAVVLPSGRLTLTAANDILLRDAARIDMAGQPVTFFDVTRHTRGGELLAESAHGDIVMAKGASIDVSADNSDAGSLTFTATDAAAGRVLLAGSLLAGGGKGYQGGTIDVRAQLIGDSGGNLSRDFAALNAELDKAGFTEGRSFALKQGDLVVGNALRARAVNVSVDGGSLAVNGLIDASGLRPGIIRLAARDDLVLAASAALDVHGSELQVDSYGQPVEAKNRGEIELTSSEGWLRLGSGTTLNLASPDGVARGKVELNTGRTGETSGDLRIDAAGTVNIAGAGGVSLNAFWRYSPTDEAGTIVQNNGGTTPVDANGSVGLDQIDVRSVQFIDAAFGNSDLASRMAGLSAYRDAFRLSPGVEINSRGTLSGNLTVIGDIDLSGYRYGPTADRDTTSAAYGAGSPLALVIRAADGLTIKGSISDGFAPVQATPDAYAGVAPVDEQGGAVFYGDLLGDGTPAYELGFNTDYYFVSDWTVPDTAFYQSLNNAFGIYFRDANFNTYLPGSTIPAGTRFSAFNTLYYEANGALPTVAAGLTLGLSAGNGTSVRAPVLDAGSQSATIRLVSGAELGSADTRAMQQKETLANYHVPGSSTYSGLINDVSSSEAFSFLDNPYGLSTTAYSASGQFFLTEDWRVPETSLYYFYVGGIAGSDGQYYSPGQTIPAGTQVVNPVFETSQALPSVATNLTVVEPISGRGHLVLDNSHVDAVTGQPGLSVIRTGTGNLELLAGGDIRQRSLFGVYTAGSNTRLGSNDAAYDQLGYYPDHGGNLSIEAQGDLSGFATPGSTDVANWLWRQSGDPASATPTAWAINFGSYVGTKFYGFSGFGALGGGNVQVRVGGDAGILEAVTSTQSTGLNIAVGSTGRVISVEGDASGAVVGGKLTQTGGGDLSVRVGGRLNASVNGRAGLFDSNGVLTNARGDVEVEAATIGVLPLIYGYNGRNDPRLVESDVATLINGAWGGMTVVTGDGQVSLRSRGDLVLGAVGDLGQVRQSRVSDPDSDFSTRFSLWKANTSIDLFSAGGNLAPIGHLETTNNVAWTSTGIAQNYLPPIFRAVAASGSIYYGGNGGEGAQLTLTPSAHGQLELLASRSIYAAATADTGFFPLRPYGPVRWMVSGLAADTDSLSNPFKPGDDFFTGGSSDTLTTYIHAEDPDPIRIYAGTGDLVNVLLGSVIDFGGSLGLQFQGASKSAHIRAGRDIVGFGQSIEFGVQTPSLITNVRDTDVSLISAGRDILYANMYIAGPGTLEMTAGRNIYQGDEGQITSLGPIVESDTRPGASIAVMAGIGGTVNWSALRTAYLDPANLANPARPLADPQNEGKVVKVYDQELSAWLKGRYGFAGAGAEALTYFDALAPEQQRIFLRQVYYAELKQGGREYNNADSSRFGSYLRGRQAISTLFPEKDASGATINRTGSYTAFGGSGLQTLFGGNIDMLVPGGQIIVGVQGEVPPATSGIITQGKGDISLYSQGSILLGLSRIMTTFGGSIFGWSAEGDINAGRGSKTTLVYTPPRREYDAAGNVTLSPQVPSSGAGIATLNPIPEVAPGDIDLIAPLGTIDAGEAGIRVSGNVNLAALQVLNAANIQVQGDAAGIPLPPAVNTGALTAASSATTAVVNEAAQLAERARPQVRTDVPNVVVARFIGFGEQP